MYARTAPRLGSSFLALLLAPVALAAGPLTLTDLGDLPGGDDESKAFSINNLGQIVGGSYSDLGWQAFIWESGTMTPLANPSGATYSEAYDISDAGQVVGGWSGGAVRWDAGVPTPLPALPGGSAADTYALCINSAGQAVGRSGASAFSRRAVSWQGDTVTDLGDPPGSTVAGGAATGINASGQIVGYTRPLSSPGRAFLWENGAFTDLGMLEGTVNASALEINDLGQVVGLCELPGYTQYRAFLWEDGVMTDLGGLDYPLYRYLPYGINNHTQVVGAYGDAFAVYWDPVSGMQRLADLVDESGDGWALMEAYGINDAGQIVGWGYTPTSVRHGFLLTPIPEPATAVLFALAVAAGNGRRR